MFVILAATYIREIEYVASEHARNVSIKSSLRGNPIFSQNNLTTSNKDTPLTTPYNYMVKSAANIHLKEYVKAFKVLFLDVTSFLSGVYSELSSTIRRCIIENSPKD